ncbi:hypothetical protein [Aquamicrobium sp.]|uniref:hypothetical protein n=1 Tax=Aquamicrobium sp. TaxID=1872579 RepID=UPI0025839AD3|nr:hypothetical protein [Aquamicrobium sp.]MCK9551694.1 hypothetical protein [Aquamicrobium sp.]
MKLIFRPSLAALLGLGLCASAFAETEKPQSIAFAGGALTITQKEEYGEKTLSFGDKELASAYVIYFDQIARLGDTEVALFDVGDGGNACGPAKVLVWKGDNDAIQRASIGEEDCGAPVTAVASDWIYFVPWLMPGTSGVVKRWTPQDGFTIAGELVYAPEAGTTWKDFNPERLGSMLEAFQNEAVYAQAKELLGDRLEEVATSLMVSAEPEKTASGLIYGDGCIPHACGTYDGFMAVDAASQKLYLARQTDGKSPETWPEAGTWPADLRQTMEKALAKSE